VTPSGGMGQVREEGEGSRASVGGQTRGVIGLGG